MALDEGRGVDRLVGLIIVYFVVCDGGVEVVFLAASEVELGRVLLDWP